MTAQEFGEWKVWFMYEQQLPAHERYRHAQLQAGISNGPLTRKVGGLFASSEFLPPDPWAPPEAQRAEPEQQTTEQFMRQVDMLNSMMG